MKIRLPLYLACALVVGILLGFYLPKNQSANGFFSDSKSAGKIDNLFQLIQTQYVDTVNGTQLTDAAIEAVLKQLDPHSAYIPASDLEDENDFLQGNFEGIGVQFRMESDTVYVIMPLKGGPSQKAGILGGDRIVKINDSVVAGKQISDRDIIRMLKGRKGTKVHLSIKRQGISKLLDFDIIRDVIPSSCIDYFGMLTSEIGYIRINKFSATTHREFLTSFKQLRNQGMQKLILDLRGNGGGYLDQAIDLADEFLSDKELIVYTEGHSRKRADSYATRKGNFEKGYLAIMVDEYSASASEILAGAIQDNDRGLIFGRRSFGKGLVQEQFEMNDGSAIRLTIARYYTPSGRCIQRPYAKGSDEYYEEYLQRLLSNEFEDKDSVHFADTTVYKTLKGRKVFGGGGIMPDEYLAHKKDSLVVYYNKLVQKGLLQKFCFEYCDKNRTIVSKYKSEDEFLTNFTEIDALFEKFLIQAEKDGVHKDSKSLSKYGKKLKTLMKAYIAQNFYGDTAFYKVYMQIDDDLQTTLNFVKNQK